MFRMTRLQRLIAFAAAIAIAVLLWLQFEEGSIFDGPWLIGILAVAGLLLLATYTPSANPNVPSSIRTPINAGRPKASVSALYTSARNQADKFFKQARMLTEDAKTSASLETQRAYLVRVFAYLGPKFLLNAKVKGFHETRANAELAAMAADGFKALIEMEEVLFPSQVPEIAGIVKSPGAIAISGSRDAVKRLDSIFAECASNLIADRQFPLDPLFSEFERLAALTEDNPASRQTLYQPLFRDFYASWDNCDLSGIDMSRSAESAKPSMKTSPELNQALDALLTSMETTKHLRPDTALPVPAELRRAILIEALRRDERKGLSALYDEKLSKAEFEQRKEATQARVSRLIEELGKTSAHRVERLFERLASERSDLTELEESIRASSDIYKNCPPLNSKL